MATIKVVKSKQADIKTYINQHKSSEFEIDKLPASNVFYIVAYDGDNIIGVLVAKAITVAKKSFLSIKVFITKEAAIAKQLLEELQSVVNESSSRGIFTNAISTENTLIQKALTTFGFKEEAQVFLGKRSKIKTVPIRDDVTVVPFKRSNRSEYNRIFSKLLLEHDEANNTFRNQVYRTKLFNEHLVGSKAQNIRISYFIAGVLNSPSWNVFLLFVDDEPIGFAKGIVSKTHPCFPDIYLKEKYRERYTDSAMSIFAKDIPESQQELGKYVSTADKIMLHACKKWFGEPIASTFVKML